MRERYPEAEDPLQEEMATHSSENPMENPMGRGGWLGYSPWGPQSVGHVRD